MEGFTDTTQDNETGGGGGPTSANVDPGTRLTEGALAIPEAPAPAAAEDGFAGYSPALSARVLWCLVAECSAVEGTVSSRNQSCQRKPGG